MTGDARGEMATGTMSGKLLHTCISCRIGFEDAEVQRAHYKTDWHRYNLKRKVVELPPVTAEEFATKLIRERSNAEQAAAAQPGYCVSCRKSFTTANSFANHLNSKKHQENQVHVRTEESLGHADADADADDDDDDHNDEDSEVEEVDSDEWEDDTDIDVTNCLFCEHHSRSLERNMRHMTLQHSFFIPDAEYCVDLDGLVTYLSEKVNVGFLCLWCNEKGRGFRSADATQRHMRDKGHCKMIHEGLALAEYADFYDYSRSYPDYDPTTKNMNDEEVDIPDIDGNDYQLVLPSGTCIGHRSLMRYYKQNLNPNKAVVPSTNRKLHKVLTHYRSLGWTTTQKEIVARKAKDIQYMKRVQTKWSTALSVKANKLQQHFRPQVNF